jgi:hypothetical protein
MNGKLVEAQKAYIKLLEEACGNGAIFMHLHGVRAPQSDIDEGVRLRALIAEAEKSAVQAPAWHTKEQLGQDLRLAFIYGAKWWEYHSTKGTMWQSDQHLVAEAAERRYHGYQKQLDGEACKECGGHQDIGVCCICGGTGKAIPPPTTPEPPVKDSLTTQDRERVMGRLINEELIHNIMEHLKNPQSILGGFLLAKAIGGSPTISFPSISVDQAADILDEFTRWGTNNPASLQKMINDLLIDLYEAKP